MNYLTKLEELEQELYDKGIQVLEEPITPNIDAVAIKCDNRYGIFLNAALELDSSKKEYLLCHELAHIETSSFYNFNNYKRTRKSKEMKAIKEHLRHYPEITPEQLKKHLENGLQVWDLAEIFNCDEDLIKDAIYYYTHKVWKV